MAELSQRDVPKDCPNGTFANKTARDALGCPNGTSLRRVPAGHFAGAAERIRSYACPDGFSPSRWRRLQDGAARFAESAWAARALALGWSEAELLTFDEPFANVSRQGAAWFVGNSTIAAVTADAITLRTEAGSTLRLYRRGPQ